MLMQGMQRAMNSGNFGGDLRNGFNPPPRGDGFNPPPRGGHHGDHLPGGIEDATSQSSNGSAMPGRCCLVSEPDRAAGGG